MSERPKVLVIDDEPAMASSVARVLQRAFDVTTCFRAHEALESIRNGARYQAIVCDLVMPEMDGVAFHQGLSEIAPELAERVLFLTGGAASEHTRAFIAAHASRCVLKPFSLSELRDRVQAIASK